MRGVFQILFQWPNNMHNEHLVDVRPPASLFPNAQYTQLNNSSVVFSTRTGNIYHTAGGT